VQKCWGEKANQSIRHWAPHLRAKPDEALRCRNPGNNRRQQNLDQQNPQAQLPNRKLNTSVLMMIPLWWYAPSTKPNHSYTFNPSPSSE
jgi:hypothetical protein